MLPICHTPPTLLDLFRLSLVGHPWRERLLQERLMKNIPETQARILQVAHDFIEAGLDQWSHRELAGATRTGLSTVKDALRRAKAIGLLEWTQQYEVRDGERRQVANRYMVRFPPGEPVARPEIRRRSKPRKPLTSILTAWSPQCDDKRREAPPGYEARFAAKIIEEKRALRARQATWGR